MARDEGIQPDPICDRCGVPILHTRSAVRRDGQTYCCASCARADDPEKKAIEGVHGRACSRCGAPIADRASAVAEETHLFCCANCAAAGVAAEPLPEARVRSGVSGGAGGVARPCR